MNENSSNDPPIPKLDTELKIKIMERMIKSAPNEELKQQLAKELAELKEKNN
jgi:hypothetical protein